MGATASTGGQADGSLGDAAPERSLKPNRGRWDGMLARSRRRLDAALRASLSTDRRDEPLTVRQRALTLGAALAGAGGVAVLAILAALHPDLGGYEAEVLLSAVGAAAVPAALGLRRAVAGAGSAAAPDPAVRRRGASYRVAARAAAVAWTRDDIAARERRLAERIAAGEGGPGPERAPFAQPRRNIEEALPADLAESLADLQRRERRFAERPAAARVGASPAAARVGASPAAGPQGRGRTVSDRATPPSRRHARIKPRHTRTLIALEDGRKLNATILDVSQSGVAIEGNLPGLWIGSMVTVGSRRAKAVRMLARGMAFEFSLPIPAEALTVDLVL